MLGASLLGQKKFSDAEPLLLSGYAGMAERETTIPPNGKLRLSQTIERLLRLYTDWHAAEPGKGYDAKATEWQTKLKEHQAASSTPPAAATPEPGK